MCQMCEEYDAELRRMGIAMNEIRINLDDRQIDALEKRARAHGHDVADEVREIIRASIGTDASMPREERLERLRRFRAALPPQTSDSLALLREDRER